MTRIWINNAPVDGPCRRPCQRGSCPTWDHAGGRCGILTCAMSLTYPGPAHDRRCIRRGSRRARAQWRAEQLRRSPPHPMLALVGSELRMRVLAGLQEDIEKRPPDVAWEIYGDGLTSPRPLWWAPFVARVRRQLYRLVISGDVGVCGGWYYRRCEDE